MNNELWTFAGGELRQRDSGERVFKGNVIMGLPFSNGQPSLNKM